MPLLIETDVEKYACKDLYRMGPMKDSTTNVDIFIRIRDFAGTYVEQRRDLYKKCLPGLQDVTQKRNILIYSVSRGCHDNLWIACLSLLLQLHPPLNFIFNPAPFQFYPFNTKVLSLFYGL